MKKNPLRFKIRKSKGKFLGPLTSEVKTQHQLLFTPAKPGWWRRSITCCCLPYLKIIIHIPTSTSAPFTPDGQTHEIKKKKSKNRRVFFYSRIIKISLKSYSKEREKIEMQTDRQTKNVHNYMRIRKKLIIIKNIFNLHTHIPMFVRICLHTCSESVYLAKNVNIKGKNPLHWPNVATVATAAIISTNNSQNLKKKNVMRMPPNPPPPPRSSISLSDLRKILVNIICFFWRFFSSGFCFFLGLVCHNGHGAIDRLYYLNMWCII